MSKERFGVCMRCYYAVGVEIELNEDGEPMEVYYRIDNHQPIALCPKCGDVLCELEVTE